MSAIGIEKENFEKICNAITSIKAIMEDNNFSSDVKIEKIKKDIEIIERNL